MLNKSKNLLKPRSKSSNPNQRNQQRKNLNEKISRLLFNETKNKEYSSKDLDPNFNDYVLAKKKNYKPLALRKIKEPVSQIDLERYLNKLQYKCHFQ